MSSNERQPSKRITSPTSICLISGCALLSLFMACAAVLVVGLAGYALWYVDDAMTELRATEAAESEARSLPLAVATRETASAGESTSPTDSSTTAEPSDVANQKPVEGLQISVPSEIVQLSVEQSYRDNLEALAGLIHPPRDYHENASRLHPDFSGARTVTRQPYRVGDRQQFQIDEGGVEAELLAVTDHAYFWIDRDLDYSRDAVQEQADRFEEEFYPVVLQLFGEEWRPGVDNDDHFSVLHLADYSGDGELGFFNSGDEYPNYVVLESNEQEMVYLNMANLDLGSDLYHGTLIHEIQHLVQWHNDANETIWLSEGIAQFTELYANLDTVETPADYLQRPYTRLDSWEFEDEDAIYAHYGAAYLFTVYIWEQLGRAAVSALVQEEADDLTGVRTVLGRFAPDISLEEFFGNWLLANLLDDQDQGAQFGYANLRLPRPSMEDVVLSKGINKVKEIDQFGVHYIELAKEGPTTVTFAGDTVAELIGGAGDGSFWYAPAPDEIDARLTMGIDIPAVERISLEFDAWYDLEPDYDFAYVSVSADGGNSWEVIDLRHGSEGEYGLGFTGQSDEQPDSSSGWINEVIDLSPYVGRRALVRFEVLTDSAIGGRGLAVGGVRVPELNLDLDNDIDSWLANGFVRTGRLLPQNWELLMVEEGDDRRTTRLDLNELNQGQWTFDLGEDGGILVISPVNPHVETPATYWLKVN